MARGPGLRKALAEKFDDELKFFKGWIDKPKTVGSIVPTSSITARKMASIVNPRSGLPVLEVGPGTGVITRAILAQGVKPENLYAVEYSTDFVRHLRGLYPGVNVIEGDAFNLNATLGDKRDMVFDSVVSGVPLLNFAVAQRIAYIESLLDRIPAGRPIVQLTYGPLSPIPAGRGDYTVEHFDFIFRNIPPTQLWIYRRPSH
ncbi:MAG: methyltransferase domain-containing protein [Mesorhizobium sp.]|uniref:phospholipid N-methyltransferase PmtA n=1 Tax=Mesorhizobium sp. TaxID=1871066 RepID=UPI000FE9BE92|nr:class I SAM-dependent methyltransferase [Mesorhizobium sp.]RWL82185.1 MAG: methyltransferase domain-containing protein [Mesorhizobium sp.]RWL87409.1 MAG: methyltransferase domain-containing protein [Mesorhizobium sp.]RWL96904.1 MAG: methyltransferase domain-containing protein [Mesorhizobium sp.]RWL98749.1 MAG: methyltransferase domain-containing protein [Mesorhizobium sp.]TIP02747.1 MAG: methyltransferase domain-containing protein [Mesorhizobium sp.]